MEQQLKKMTNIMLEAKGSEPGTHKIGTAKSITKADERFVFAIRGCNDLYHPICTNMVGAQLLRGLKTVFQHTLPHLREWHWTIVINHRIAYGLATCNFGNQSLDLLKTWELSAADFSIIKNELLEEASHHPAAGTELEPRPTAPTDIEKALKNWKNQAYIFSLMFGEDHAAERQSAAEEFNAMHSEFPQAYPFDLLVNTWERLFWRYKEEFNITIENIVVITGSPSPSEADFKLAAHATDKNGQVLLQWPLVFDVANKDGFFVNAIMGRWYKKLEGNHWDNLYAS